MKKTDQGRQGHHHYREMTVAHIREQKGVDYVEVVFLESARFYRLLRENPAYDEALRLLRDVMTKGQVLKVRFASLDTNIIEEVQEPTPDIFE